MEKTTRIALLDFDGTLVTEDILDVLCQKVGKGEESRQLNESFHRGEMDGRTTLIARINFLKGMTKSQIFAVLEQNNYLMPGVRELINFFKNNGFVTILASGNILPVLEFYQKLLGIDFIVGSQPRMNEDAIEGIDESAFSATDFKIAGINNILKDYTVSTENIVALGDSPSDKTKFAMSGYSIAVNPKGDIAEFADAVVKDDLNEAVKLLEARFAA